VKLLKFQRACRALQEPFAAGKALLGAMPGEAMTGPAPVGFNGEKWGIIVLAAKRGMLKIN